MKLTFKAALTLSFLTAGLVKAQNIDKTLIQNAIREGVDAVILFDNTEFNIENEGNSVTTRHWAVLINNDKAAEEHNDFRAYYDKFSKVRKIDGNLYDVSGKVLQKLKTRDLNELSLTALSDGVSDNMVKVASFDAKNYSYPYVVEFSYEKQDKNMLFYPSWMPLTEEKTYVQSSSFTIRSANIPFKVKERNTQMGGIIRDVSSPYFKRWQLKNVSLDELERYSKHEHLPMVKTAPTQFSIEDYSGIFNSWEDVSSFYYTLNKGRDKLPAEEINKVKNLIKPGMTTTEKVAAVYQYMQSRTRYMSIQLGIGGWQSIPADEVSRTGYGDCKALTNFTIALLKAVGVQAHPALIDAGKNSREIYDDFPCMTFNHVIACVPAEKDTIWLECTSQTEATGYQGSFTGNRKTLLIKEKGGKLVYTTQYKPEHNFQHRTAQVWLDKTGEAKIEIASTYGGLQQDYRAHVSTSLDNEEQRKFMMNSINISNFELNNFQLKVEKKVIPEVQETAEVYSKKLASASGKRLFLKPNLLSTFYTTPIEKDDRVSQIYLNPNTYSFEDTDEIIYHLPEGYKTESMKERITFESTFGKYSAHITREGNTLKYNRKVIMNGGSYAKEKYPDLVEFIKEVNKADRQRVVFVSEGT